jgi:hypothetical protein
MIRMRQEQEKNGLFPELFQNDELGLTMRPYVRLKYLETIIDNPLQYIAVKMQGIVLGCRQSSLGSSMFSIWNGPIQDPVFVNVVVDKIRSTVAGAVSEGDNVVDFGPYGPLWAGLEGKTVEIRLRGGERLWELKGLAGPKMSALSREVFWRRVEKPNLYTEANLRRDVMEIIRLPCYVEEENAKSRRQG